MKDSTDFSKKICKLYILKKIFSKTTTLSLTEFTKIITFVKVNQV